MTRDYATVEVIIAVYDSIGTKLYSYTYDPWGRFVRTQVFVTPSTAIVNPYLYRGYYYDSDLGFYYLQSRYYDPITCRFINADEMMSGANGDLHGFNLYVYCFNNPVMLTDSEGNWPDWIQKKIDEIQVYAKKIEKAIAKVLNKINAIKAEAEKDAGNTDVDVVYKSTHASSYKGVLVIRHSVPFLSSFAICGIIFLQRYDINYLKSKDTINHEYGHILQENDMGTIKYFISVAIPSVTYNYLLKGTSYYTEYYYYSMSWEYDADIRGNVKRNSQYAPWAESTKNWYFDIWG